MKYALISVSDKTNIVKFSKELVELGFSIISTGGTKKSIEESGIKVISIDEFTGFPEILDGRVKTLHPLVHGGLLSVRDNVNHVKEVEDNNIKYIDLVVVNLYPFKETIAKDDVTYEEAIENIDIGGPSMLRSAAKNQRFVTALCDSSDYDLVIDEFKKDGETSFKTRSKLAAKVFRHTASYDAAISNYLTKEIKDEYAESITLSYELKQELRYGENPHQKAKFYKGSHSSYSLAYGKQLHGKAMSYNNIQDGNAALQITKEFDKPVVVAVKHMNPCGVGIGNNINDAWNKAYASDPVSIYGGIVSTNQEVTEEVALKMKDIFLEIILAPSFSEGALKVLTKKKNLRLITVDMSGIVNEKQFVSVSGGLLVQDLDSGKIESLEVVTKRNPSKEEMSDLMFAWKACKHVKSNAILLAKDLMTVGIGAGQTSRVGAAKIALEWAKEHNHINDLVLASDAFLPFDDVVKIANEYGVKAIIQPGGSIRDELSIKACDDLGIAMVFTKMRHFKH